MILGYNTNGFAHHRLADAVEVIAELSYGGVAVTPHYGALTRTPITQASRPIWRMRPRSPKKS